MIEMGQLAFTTIKSNGMSATGSIITLNDDSVINSFKLYPNSAAIYLVTLKVPSTGVVNPIVWSFGVYNSIGVLHETFGGKLNNNTAADSNFATFQIIDEYNDDLPNVFTAQVATVGNTSATTMRISILRLDSRTG